MFRPVFHNTTTYNFVHGDHSDILGIASNSASDLEELVGQDLTNYFPPPLTAYAGLSGPRYSDLSRTYAEELYFSCAARHAHRKRKNYHKGPLVWTTKEIAAQAAGQTVQRIWAIWEGGIYDLTDYINTVTINQGATSLYQFLSTDVSDVFEQQAGQDITQLLNAALAGLDSDTAAANINCLKNMFYLGETDFRDTPRCLIQNYLLMVFTSILCASI
ncbi:hypothetical protein BDR04DRAFT_1164673, partial [Suillus decipiens]